MNITKLDKCTGCGLCKQLCPKQCVTMQINSEGFAYPVIDESICIKCNVCAVSCPANKESKMNSSSLYYQAWYKHDDVILNSSSGGAFTAIAEVIFSRAGVVFGATYNVDTWEVYHIIIENKQDLEKIRMSKYYQSDVRDTFLKVKEQLKKNRYVLYSGTACQISALLQYLKNNNTEKLYTVDILCHGVSSKKVVMSYIASKEKRYKKNIQSFQFRTKKIFPWKNGGGCSIKLNFKDSSQKVIPNYEDTFMKAFNENIILRESCYQCKYAQVNRVSDFTLGDFWGVDETTVPKEYLEKGISLMLVNSEKGKALLPYLAPDFEYSEVNPEAARPFNRSLIAPPIRNNHRENFFSRLEGEDFDRIITGYYMQYFLKLK